MPFKLILCPKPELDKTALALKVVFQVRVAPVGCTVPAATRLSSGLLEQGPGGPLKIRADVTRAAAGPVARQATPGLGTVRFGFALVRQQVCAAGTMKHHLAYSADSKLAA